MKKITCRTLCVLFGSSSQVWRRRGREMFGIDATAGSMCGVARTFSVDESLRLVLYSKLAKAIGAKNALDVCMSEDLFHGSEDRSFIVSEGVYFDIDMGYFRELMRGYRASLEAE